jgi:hypothetical protein
MSALYVLGGLISLACTIFIMVKMFPVEGLLKTILAFFCGIYALIWGWQHQDKIGNKFVMPVFTVAYLLALIGNVFARGR